jgi:hypothetical protein
MPGMPLGPEVQHVKDPRSGAGVLYRLLRDAGLRRRTFLAATGVAVIVVVLATVLLTVIPLSSFKTTSDRLTWAGDVLVGATLLLAAIAAIVALVAYAVSTGLPDLQFSVQFGDSAPNNPVFEADIQDGALRSKVVIGNFGKVLLRNSSGYSAKNPAVIVRLQTMFFIPRDRVSFEREWASMETADVSDWLARKTTDGHRIAELIEGLTVVQWDGGPTYSVHGHSTRRLPDLQFSDLWHMPDWGEKPVLTFEILAEGYRRAVDLPVDFIVDGKSQYSQEKQKPYWI